MARPAKLPYPAAGRVVKACRMLNEERKLEWLEHVTLDNGEGAYISAEHMGQRLGKSRDTIERGRRELAQLGLLAIGQRERGKTGTYYPVLPKRCIPNPRPSPAEIGRLADLLDEHIRAVRSGEAPEAGLSSDDIRPHGGVRYFTAAELDREPARVAALAPPFPHIIAARQPQSFAAPQPHSCAAVSEKFQPSNRAQSGGIAVPPPSLARDEGRGELMDEKDSTLRDESLASLGKTREEKKRVSPDGAGSGDPTPIASILDLASLMPPEARAAFLAHKAARASVKGAA